MILGYIILGIEILIALAVVGAVFMKIYERRSESKEDKKYRDIKK
ncbi:MAG: hypothetical protein ABIE68_04690 [bacterium]